MTKSSATWIFNLSVAVMLLTVPAVISQNYFSSIARMKILPSLQKEVHNQLENILNQFRTDLREMNETSERLKAVKIQPKNKVDLFVFINKLLTLKKHLAHRYKLSLETEDIELPTRNDVDGNLFSLLVLQSTYNLNINNICKGLIRQDHTRLDLVHKLLIISSYYDVHHSHVYPIRALHESIESINERVNIKNYLFKDVQTKHSWMDIANLYRIIFEKLVKKHKRYVLKLIRYILEYLQRECKTFQEIFISTNQDFLNANRKTIRDNKGDLGDLEKDSKTIPPSSWNPYEEETLLDMPLKQYQYYTQLCQGVHNFKSEQPLVCYFSTSGDVYYLLNPFKMEQLTLDPPIVLLREFVTEKEIRMLIRESVPWLRKSVVGRKGKSFDSMIRISQNTWLDYEIPPTLSPLAGRIASAVPLEDEAEPLQVNNYGVGGQYTPHLDNIYQWGNPTLDWDRLATFMIYLTDNSESGATVFPILNLTVYPCRGCAIFWYNLYSNFAPDYRTLHAGCPVLNGEKWVVNKWYSNRNQLFRYPCLEGERVLSRKDVSKNYPNIFYR